MAGNDNILFANLQRSLSDDYNKLQSMAARSLADIFRHLGSAPGVVAGAGGVPTSSPSAMVLGGLIATANGTQIDVSRGALAQDTAALLPVPGALDSPYRLAYQRTVETLATPAPGGNTWYLLEAQMVDVPSVAGNRDIFNPATGVFVSTPVTLEQERRLTYQFTAGSATTIPATSADFVPIAAVFRPAGGGAVLVTHIVDMRPQWQQFIDERVSTPASGTVSRWGLRPLSRPAAYLNTAHLDLEGELNGQKLFARTDGTPIDLSAAEFHENALAFPLAGTQYYLYLCIPVAGSAPSGQHANLAHRGALVVSLVPPTIERVNGAAITMGAAPFAGTIVAAGNALFVGAVNTRAAGIEPQWCSVGGEHSFSSDGDVNLGIITTFADINFDTFAAGSPIVPAAATHAKVRAAISATQAPARPRAASGRTAAAPPTAAAATYRLTSTRPASTSWRPSASSGSSGSTSRPAHWARLRSPST